MTEHWTCSQRGDGFWTVLNERGTVVADHLIAKDARLIIAAHDLLDALVALRDAVKSSGKFENRDEYLDLGIRVNRAIATATA